MTHIRRCRQYWKDQDITGADLDDFEDQNDRNRMKSSSAYVRLCVQGLMANLSVGNESGEQDRRALVDGRMTASHECDAVMKQAVVILGHQVWCLQ